MADVAVCFAARGGNCRLSGVTVVDLGMAVNSGQLPILRRNRMRSTVPWITSPLWSSSSECDSSLRSATMAVLARTEEGEPIVLFAVALLVAMLLVSARDCICFRKLLEDVGDGEAPNAASKSESFRGVELPPAMGRRLFGGDFGSMETRKKQERRSCSVSGQKCGNHKLHSYSACLCDM